MVEVGPGGGCVTSTTAVTRADGTLPISSKLGAAAGAQALVASIRGPVRPQTLTFTAMAVRGAVVDPVGDATQNTVGTPDAVVTAVDTLNGAARIRVRFAPNTFDPLLSHVTIALDTDRNVQTGSPGIDAGGNDAALMGTDAIVQIGSYFNGRSGERSRRTRRSPDPHQPVVPRPLPQQHVLPSDERRGVHRALAHREAPPVRVRAALLHEPLRHPARRREPGRDQ